MRSNQRVTFVVFLLCAGSVDRAVAALVRAGYGVVPSGMRASRSPDDGLQCSAASHMWSFMLEGDFPGTEIQVVSAAYDAVATTIRKHQVPYYGIAGGYGLAMATGAGTISYDREGNPV